MAHFMIDLETMGNKPDAPITSIGAVIFSMNGVSHEFYARVDLSSSVKHGGIMDADTVKWWLTQDPAAQQEMTGGGDLIEALNDLSDFMRGDDPIVWGNGAAFDNVILAAHYDRCCIYRPWKFWNDRCYRTMKSLFPDVKMDRSGTHHNALDDAKSQAVHLINICKEKGVNL